MNPLSRPTAALGLGVAIAVAALLLWFRQSNGDTLGLISFVLRFLHIVAAMLWVGMIWFVNFIQIAALGSVDDPTRQVLLTKIVLPVALVFRVASNSVLVTGIGLLVTTGYLLDRWVFPSAVYIASVRGAMLWSGVVAGLAMWALVHFVVWPSLRMALDAGATEARRQAARQRLQRAARINLVLAVPVTFAMVAAAHLY